MANDITVTKIITSGQERFDINYSVDASGSKIKTLLTAGKLLDRNIKVTINTPAGAHAADSSSSSNSTVTPSVAINNASTYGFTTTTPSGTNGTNYLTINPEASATTWSVTPRSKITTAGYLTAGNVNGTAISDTPSIAAGTNYYIPVITPSITGGDLTATNYSGTPTITLSDGSDKNISNFSLGSKDATNYPYYFKINSTSGALNGTTSVARSDIKLTNGAGVIVANSNVTKISSTSKTASVSIGAGSNSIYLGIKGAIFETNGNTVTVNAAGYVPQGTTVGTVNTGTITNNTTLPSGSSSSGTINRGNYIKIGAGYYSNTVYYLAQANSGTLNIASYTGAVSVDGKKNITLNTTSVTQGTTTVSSNNTVTRGTASWGQGWIQGAGSIIPASFSNSATSGVSYVDISNTTEAPMLVSNDYLYINQGYTDNLKISLAKLVPDDASAAALAAGHILSGYSAYNNDGLLIAGNIPTRTANNVSFSGKTVTVTAGYYASDTTKNMGDGAYSASVSAHSISTTPVVTISASGKFNSTDASAYGVTSTKPSGTDGTNYLGIDGSGSVTTTGVSSATGKATISTAGYLGTGNKTSNSIVNITPTITDNFAARYIPIVTASFSGGGLTNTSNYVNTPTITLATGNETNMSNITIGAKDTTNYPYYFKVNGTSGALSGTTTVSRAAVTYTNSAGAIVAHSGTTAISAGSSSPTVTINAGSGSTYVGIKEATYSGNSASASISTAASDSSSITLASSAPSSGAYYTLTANGSGSSKITGAGYIGTGGLTAASTTTKYYLPRATSSTSNGTASATANAGTASITTQPSASASTSATMNGMDGGYYTDTTTSSYYIDVTASASSNSGVVTATGGSASASVTASSATLGVGYNPASITASTTASSTGTKTGNTATTTAVTASDSKNTKIYLKASTITTSFTADGMSTYFNSGTSNDKNVTITPKYTATAGYRPAVGTATNNGGTTYYKIKTATPAFDGGAISGSVTSITGSNVTLSDTNNGISVTGAASAGRAAVLYNGAVSGWVTAADNATALAATSSNTSLTGKTRYITAITVPKDKPFSLTTTADTALDTTSNITITNNAYRQLSITNAANADINITTSGQTDITVGSSSAGIITANAYPKGSGTTIVGAKTIVSAGRWAGDSGVITPNPTSQLGPYYGEIYVDPMSSGTAASISSEGSVATAPSVTYSGSTNMVTASSGTYFFQPHGTVSNGTVQTKWKNATSGYAAANTSGTNSGTVTVTPTENFDTPIYIPTMTITGSGGALNNKTASATLGAGFVLDTADNYANGLTILAKGTAGRAAVTYTNTAGYLYAHTSSSPQTISNAVSATTWNGATYYIKGVKLTAPTSGTKKFDITIPNGNTTDFITFQFIVDSSGNVQIVGP